MTATTRKFTPTALRVCRPAPADLFIVQEAALKPITQLAGTSFVSCTVVEGGHV